MKKTNEGKNVTKKKREGGEVKSICCKRRVFMVPHPCRGNSRFVSMFRSRGYENRLAPSWKRLHRTGIQFEKKNKKRICRSFSLHRPIIP